MSISSLPSEASDESLIPTVEPPAVYLATILGVEVWWQEGPVWLDGEPIDHTFELDGSIRADYLVDVNRIPGYVRVPKRMDCGHTVPGGGYYVTWLASDLDVCLPCAEEQPWVVS